MSQENVEIVRRSYDAGNRGDWDAAFRDAAPDFEVTFKAGPNAGTYRGREALESVFRDMLSGFDFWIMEPVEFREQRRSGCRRGGPSPAAEGGYEW